jgi:serine/threonine-protein kinase/endoribonuclease IRE1
LSKGDHPFGKRYERERNIMQQQYNLNSLDLDLVQERKREAQNLIEQMIKNNPSKRPTIDEILKHIYFWSNDKKLKLIQDLSDRLEFNN